MTSIENFNLVTGYRGLFYQKAYDVLLQPFCERFGISRQFEENNAIWLGIVVVIGVAMLIMVLYDIRHPEEAASRV